MSGDPYPKSAQVPARKKYRRTVASAKTWAKIRDERLGPCVVCVFAGIEQQEPSSLHHVVPRDRRGDDVAKNLISLCGTGTTGHHGLVEAGDRETCRLLADHIQQNEPDTYAYAIGKLGEDDFLRLHRVEFRGAA